MNLNYLTFLLKDAVSAGAEQALSQTGVLSERLSKAEAYRLFGRCDVDRWICEGLITIHPNDQDTPTKHINRSQLLAVAAKSNRVTYLPVIERPTRSGQ